MLFDQDKGALAYAWRRLKNVVDAKWQKRVQVLCLNESIKRLLRDRELFSNFGDFDAVFSCGLFDYLQPATAVVLTRNLFSRLAPAGKLFIGNMVPENPTRYIMEHHLDWQLIYRPAPNSWRSRAARRRPRPCRSSRRRPASIPSWN